MGSDAPDSAAPADESELDSIDAPVYPYDYNPSSWSQRIPICVLATVAAVISVHLSLYQWKLIETTWDPVFGDQSNKVLDSNVAKDMYRRIGIHDAALGALAYLGDCIFGLAGSTRRWQYRPWMVILFGIDVIPLGIVSVILVIAQAFVVGYWCFLCLVTALISLILVYWAWDEVSVSIRYLWRVKKRGGWSALWKVFWGGRHPVGVEVGREMVREAG
ncbi:vitamin K epoxide reductase family protein [Candidatus Laterigemmans baculatus]|uniref:vitamin K epoxide reductase family protein n=1 Tax=Candidatus Laterigemmans baculatus TaxID=2770505 RepID=UPI0013D9AE40|nr:vitamin K epoxide reductase family protein [Candidatus Laterigemmans baculatus]